MDANMLKYLIYGTLALLGFMVIAYLVIRKLTDKSDIKYARQLREGTKADGFSSEIIFQKLYMIYIKIIFVRRYLIKLRRRIEILNIEDEYLTRLQASKILTKALLIVLPITVVIILFTYSNLLLLSILIILEVFMIETLIDGMVDKMDSKLLKQQVDFFSEIRHAYHEFNMVEEAIYQVSLDDELEVSRQAEKVYEVLISDDPESELEKYYDIAPNSYLKEFAGISYLTKEFGDRQVNGASLYLRNLNNITQEMQIEILKRDKLDYVFQSLSIIAAIPLLFIEPLKKWAIGNFGFTASFYNGKWGLLVQLLLLFVTFLCYILIRKIKDSSSTNANLKNTENPIQAKLYKKPLIKKFVDMFIPKKGTKEYIKIIQLLKDSASNLKIEWLFINRIFISLISFIIMLFVFVQMHTVAISYVYEEPTNEYDLIGSMNEKDLKKAEELTEQDNYFLDKLKGKHDITVEEIKVEIVQSDYYEDETDEEVQVMAERILTKLRVINAERLGWFEVLMSMVFAIVGYMFPLWLLIFQKKIRQLEMEDEVMQFQTIILMLMKIERVNVEMILEWLERYANIFKEPITKCVNNYESGAWEALEELKNDISYMQLIRIVESLQAAVEKIPIKDAFDELETERDYYQEKRKASNEKLISRKGLIGKVIGFAPMICLFVGYLIIPLVAIGLMSMTNSFATMSSIK